MNKSVLITGGALRLGAELCTQFAVAGWTVWCHYQHSEAAAMDLCEKLNGRGHTARPVQADLGDSTQRQRMMTKIESITGSLRCLVNNASSFEPDSADQFDIASARSQLEVNLLAPMELSSLMAQSISKNQCSGISSIIHVLDQKVFNLNPSYFSYTVTKLALERTVSLQAQALAPKLRVCGVAPGLMYLSGPQSPKNFEHASQINLLRRATDPSQVAATCLFLAENNCITGVTVPVDNGQHLIPLPKDVMYVIEDLSRASQ
jgi:NAD(P)-dependent dehydrogenase (short-subunit alcohol dehydrogenase family)